MTRHELLAWHVGALDRDAGTRVEAHLATCGECLEAFFAMKRLAADGGPTPSAALAARLPQ
jgi:anti-sigma factor RsiW